jgi:acyl carrier protein
VDELTQLLSELLDEEGDALGDETPFADCSAWDSLKHVELVVGIQARFDVDLTADEIGRMTSKRAAREVLMARGAR